MWDTLKYTVSAFLIGLSLWLMVMFIWIDFIEWRLIPQSEIESSARKLLQEHGTNATEVAQANLEAAQNASDPSEIGRCKRINKAVQAISNCVAD